MPIDINKPLPSVLTIWYKDVKLKGHIQTMLNICEFYGVVCFDAILKSSMTLWSGDFKDRHYQEIGDTDHLNDTGYNRLLTKV